ncbi:MAG: hypothetical protein U5M23_13185 [Marinagarivorans sp.]|nr:hypothetical protein [Marinagarivorans sp.]
MDLQGRVWVKNGSDKRHVTSREEMQRMFLNAGLIRADIVPVTDSTIDDLDEKEKKKKPLTSIFKSAIAPRTHQPILHNY